MAQFMPTKKADHVGTVTWRIEMLKRKTEAPNHVGSGDC